MRAGGADEKESSGRVEGRRRTTKTHVLFVHGAGGEAYEVDGNLVRSLRETLASDFEVRYPKMPGGEAPGYGAWSDRISRELSASNGEVILVGHSLGGSILLKHLSEERVDKPIAGVFLIATPYWGTVDWEVAEFELREDFPAALPEDVPIFLYHSRDDEVVPFAHLALYAGRLPRATVREFEDRGHQLGDDLSEVTEDIARLQRR
jgi:predicted alpha/beta hydrolase family esterase